MESIGWVSVTCVSVTCIAALLSSSAQAEPEAATVSEGSVTGEVSERQALEPQPGQPESAGPESSVGPSSNQSRFSPVQNQSIDATASLFMSIDSEEGQLSVDAAGENKSASQPTCECPEPMPCRGLEFYLAARAEYPRLKEVENPWRRVTSGLAVDRTWSVGSGLINPWRDIMSGSTRRFEIELIVNPWADGSVATGPGAAATDLQNPWAD